MRRFRPAGVFPGVMIEPLEVGLVSYEDFLATDGHRLRRLLVAHYGLDIGT